MTQFPHQPLTACLWPSETCKSAGDRLSSAGPHPKGKLRHRGITCPQVTLEVCGDSGHLVRPKAGQISSWEGHGGSHLSYTATKLGGGLGPPSPDSLRPCRELAVRFDTNLAQDIGSPDPAPSCPSVQLRAGRGHPTHWLGHCPKELLGAESPHLTGGVIADSGLGVL